MIAAFGLGLRSLRTPSGAVVGVFAAVVALLVTTVLGMAAALPSALSAGPVRQNDRYPVEDSTQALHPITGSPLGIAQRDTVWHGQHVGIVQVVDATGVTPPPGVRALPGAGRSVVSPGLAALLRGDATGMLADRVPRPVGEIGPTGLANPAELLAYVGVTRAEVGPDSFGIAGWGFGGGTLFRSDISPYLALPIAALVIAPMLALLVGLLQLDQRRRAARLAGLRVLGATRGQVLAADAGAILLPLLIGWGVAWPLAGPFDTAFAEHAAAGRLFFGSDLTPSVFARLGVLVLLLVVAGALSSGDTGPETAAERIEGDRPYRTGIRAAAAATLIGTGIAAAAATLNADAGAPRSIGWILGSATLMAAGTAVGLPVLVLGLCRVLTRRGVAGELARARLAGTRSSWRSAAMSLLLAGTVAGISVSVLTVLDAAGQTDQIIWNPAAVGSDTVYASLPAHDLAEITRTGRFGAPAAIIPAGTATLHGADGTSIQTPAVYVPCVALNQVIETPTPGTDPCRTAWVINDALNPHSPQAAVTLPAPGTPTATSIRTGTIRAPAELVGGTESVLIPTDPTTIHHILDAAGNTTVHAVFTLHSARRVEQLRSQLWPRPVTPFDGATGPLSTVVSKPDLLADSHHYTDNYSRMALALLILGSVSALTAAALAGAVDSDEQARRNAVLTALGARATTLRLTIRLGTYLPALTAMACGLVLGLAIGVAYLDLGDYPQLTGPLRGFPLRNLAIFGVIQLLAFAALATPTHLLATKRVRTIEATTLTGV